LIHLIAGQLRHRPARAITLAVGILVAAVSFSLLTAATGTASLETRGVVSSHFRTGYDILVRPPDSFTPLEREQGLVASNFASGIFGGISFRQWHEIQAIPGVQVAAPIANIGYVVPYESLRVLVNDFLTKESRQLYRIQPVWESNHGLSEYPADDDYVYFLTRDRLVGRQPYEELPNGNRVDSCFGFNRSIPPAFGPFTRGAQSELSCFSARSPAKRGFNFFKPGEVGVPVGVQFPVMVAAVDPVQEDRLVGLSGSIASGHGLTGDLSAVSRHRPFPKLEIPVIASTRDFVGDDLRIDVERLKVEGQRKLPAILASSRAYSYVTHLKGEEVGSRTYRAASLYRKSLELLVAEAYWTTSPVRYRERSGGYLGATTTTNPNETYNVPGSGYVAAPPNQDLQFRRVTQHARTETYPVISLKVMGRFDPFALTGFSAFSRTVLAAYAPPVARPADADSRRALRGHSLQPTMNLGGYIQQPPLMLTTLDAAESLFDDNDFTSASGNHPIRVIRVLVNGVSGPDSDSLSRIKAVAQLIAQRTGLAVDITAGSSPTNVWVHLPAGRFGSPPLNLQESWAKKGLAVIILQAVDKKSLSLFLLVLAVTVGFLVNAGLAAVRGRLWEIGVLMGLGWSKSRIFGAVLGEVVVTGAVAGIAGVILVALLLTVLDLNMPLWHAFLVAPVAIVVAALSGLWPARQAARSSPISALKPRVNERAAARRHRGFLGMALTNSMREPGRSLLAAAVLGLGVAALTVLTAIQIAFRGVLTGSLLGHYVAVQVRGVDVLSAVLTVLLSALAVADVVYLSLRERRSELAVLAACGWTTRRLQALVLSEGIVVGLMGVAAGAAIGVILGTLWGAGVWGLAEAALVAGGAGVLVSAVASIAPTRALAAQPFVRALRGE
jgi:putative ABC transport system permease protein